MTILYRIYDGDEQLLYVGISDRWDRRMAEHAQAQPWWPADATARLTRYPNRQAALAAERHAIKTERPRHNVVHNRHPQPPARPSADKIEMRWYCHGCGGKIKNGGGFISYDERARHQRKQATKEREERSATEWLIKLGKPVTPEAVSHAIRAGWYPLSLHDLDAFAEIPWHVWHDDGCVAYATSYWISLEDVMTLAEFADRAAHVGQKNWIDETDFNQFAMRVIKEFGNSWDAIPHKALFAKIRDSVVQGGPLSKRRIAHDLGVSLPTIDRAIRANHAAWSQLVEERNG